MNNKGLKYKSDFLLPKNNFIIGLGSVLNIRGSYFKYRYSKTETEADSKAIYSDWLNTGRDIKQAKDKLEKEYKK